MEQQHRTMIAAIQRGRFDGPNGSIQIPEGCRPRRSRRPSAPPAPAAAAAAGGGQGRRRSRSRATAAAEPAKRGTTRRASRRTRRGRPQPRPDDPRVPGLRRRARGGRGLTLSPTPDFVAGRSVQTQAQGRRRARPRGRCRGALVQVRILSTSARASTVFQGKTAAGRILPDLLHGAGEPQRNGGRRHPRDGAQRERRSPVPDQEETERRARDHRQRRRRMRLPAGASVADLLERLRVVDAARRRRAQPRDRAEGGVRARPPLAEGDVFEVVELVGGG